MKLAPQQIIWILVGTLAYFGCVYFVDKSVTPKVRPWVRYGAVLLTACIFFWTLTEFVSDFKRVIEVSKAAIAICAAAAVFYEAHRKGQHRPIAERWKKIVGISLALVAITLYFNGYKFGYPKYWHRWDQYHYYMGAKYFPELGYKSLYKCAVVAQDEVGRVEYHVDRPFNSDKYPRRTVDMRKEMRDPDKKVRDLPGENLLIPVTGILEHPEECRDRFTPERWEEYKQDVAFYRIVSGKGYWTDMQKDHGFNPPPVWTVAGKFFSDLKPMDASGVQFHQFLGAIDLLYLIGMLVVLWWGFGWRVFAVGAIFWGCQSSAPFYWTGGAFLRQDWLFFTVLSVACLRKQHFKIAGASLVYAGLLRVFPGLVVVGTLVPTITHLIKHRRMHKDHLQMLIGGTLAAAVLLPLSMYMTHYEEGEPFYHPYKIFDEHTIETHDKTPLTNHMGLRVIIGHKFLEFQSPITPDSEMGEGVSKYRSPVVLAKGPNSGQMEYVRDNRLQDPFERWKQMRNDRYEKYKLLAYAIILGTLAFFALVVHRIKKLWIAQCLGQIFIILGSQLTCYYYSFMIIAAPLIKARRQIELGLFALAAVTQIIWMQTYWNDNRYTLLTIVSLIYCYVMIGHFWRRPGTTQTETAVIEEVVEEEADDDWDEELEDDEDFDREEPAPA